MSAQADLASRHEATPHGERDSTPPAALADTASDTFTNPSRTKSFDNPPDDR
jgi:hypothetical protein